ncbi:hypothetical protein NC653_027642 [Populus alba x Populus x berolinensis]|uniref:Uncharacterized protein n=1 Tax=Populus alba x Populus x berolinensis TaxID=444605 RepID=A0AAD6Q743_9ROSI|nr:hypothetical protein NC653_027642 [Populus alba x Populus x berolinensis]
MCRHYPTHSSPLINIDNKCPIQDTIREIWNLLEN